eukprot:CAMPEP_0183302952 /NCGR_PEP_ID=MMETSP0160_2-20130417/8564_1 /TAXON_ID=2839 ORGANISM="Odontella Sinensis, Strain Grunow 1884" /NCGR_SAMPLE_ID=MMETSP0160_2 /ASSEMBLY_ACC=CAM_ASM_000250 /LENGTH=89 /DNA_ID=CAMNT_0025465791 /DNA_START=60 /DNA_END=326 /DNA_ORIENTATION=-
MKKVRGTGNDLLEPDDKNTNNTRERNYKDILEMIIHAMIPFIRWSPGNVSQNSAVIHEISLPECLKLNSSVELKLSVSVLCILNIQLSW